MGLTFLSQAYAKLGNLEKSKIFLRHALESRKNLINFSDKITHSEKINLLWWTKIAKDKSIKYDSESYELIEKLEEALNKEDNFAINGLINDLIRPLYPLGG